jgi:2-polyprenyl-3-methyl-5-hydroxy-6-metoxy-1,4-benzoquinol methylase
MEMETMIVGKQTEGQSSSTIKDMAMRALASLGEKRFDIMADIGAGRGELTDRIAPHANKILMLDDYEEANRPKNADFVKADLNDFWNVPDNSVDVVFSLEVIEHIENPRHFMREIKRIMKPGGYGFVSTPNNLNFFSRLNFFLKHEHRFFKDFSYPAHISVLTTIDFRRILNENGLEFVDFYYNYADTMPITEWNLRFKSEAFSSTVGVLFRKK